ncbi:MAG TPA: alpha/beta fold hydrolase [Candidatus Dormibacteraeota bacterium]|jgi:pimeloyl-ACP methyl ester carboxylesterase|nr:alpha/beta fold hydrolase [Candidatus Dormibacteraeota bacterium]
MLGLRRPAAVAVAALAALTAFAVRPAPPTAAANAPLPVTARIVTFQVKNENTSAVPCQADGAAYTIHGRLVAPQSQTHAVVLSLHGLGYGEFFWDFQVVPGYDWAASLASHGVASVVIDRLGYGVSSHPPGMQSCMGGQASIAHQVVQQLRSGSYTIEGGGPVSFSRVGLIGHSAGGGVAQIETYSFHDVDALVILAWADFGASPKVLADFGQTGAVCASGGNPPGYAPLGSSKQEFEALMFHDADPTVEGEATRLRNPDPCGDDSSIPATILTDSQQVASIQIPVLLAIGADDAIFPPPAQERQKGMFTGTKDLTAITVPNTGHALSLERSAPFTRDAVTNWLCTRGFC